MVYHTSFIRFYTTQHNWCHISESPMKQRQKPGWKSDLLWFSCGYQNCMFVDRATNFSWYIVWALLDLQNTARVTLATLQRHRCKNQIENWTSSDFSYSYRKCMFVDRETKQSTRPRACHQTFIHIRGCQECWGWIKHLGHVLLLSHDLKDDSENSCSGCSWALSSPPPWSQKVTTERDIDSWVMAVDLIAQLASMVRHIKKQAPINIFLKINQTLGCFLRQKSHEVASFLPLHNIPFKRNV